MPRLDFRATEYDLPTKDLAVALLLVVLDEVNVLRASLGLPPRTRDQLRAALKSKL